MGLLIHPQADCRLVVTSSGFRRPLVVGQVRHDGSISERELDGVDVYAKGKMSRCLLHRPDTLLEWEAIVRCLITQELAFFDGEMMKGACEYDHFYGQGYLLKLTCRIGIASDNQKETVVDISSPDAELLRLYIQGISQDRFFSEHDLGGFSYA